MRLGRAQLMDEQEAKRAGKSFFVVEEELRYDPLGESAMWQRRGRLGEGVGRRSEVLKGSKVEEKAECEDRVERRRRMRPRGDWCDCMGGAVAAGRTKREEEAWIRE